MSATGENEMGLRKIIDLTRLASLSILLLHCYFYCYAGFSSWGLRSDLTDRMLSHTIITGLFTNFHYSKLLALGLLFISFMGIKGKKSDKIQPKRIVLLIATGIFLFFASVLILNWSMDIKFLTFSYIVVTGIGFLCILSGVSHLSRLIHVSLSKDVFNELNETFPQEERLIKNEYSVNYPARYQLKGKQRNSYINIINPFRGSIVCGTPGAGKSWFVILPLIKQMIEKGYAMLIYDFKYDDLSKPAYNWMLSNMNKYDKPPSFYSLNFDNLSGTHRCNPLDPQNMLDITDATESARTILLGLNREWIKRQGDFFVESPINFVTAVIWYLRKYGNGCFCTLPHVIEMMQVGYEELFAVLNTEPEIQVLINPFITAYENDAMEQLEGQVASAKICMARLASPQLYWVLSGNDFTLDINDPEHPKIVCIGNNPEKQAIYGAVLSLYISRLVKLVNRKGKQKCALVFDEFPTIYFNNMDSLIATARSNKVAPVLGMQDFSQLRKDYGKEQADVIVNICGNIISGQVMGDSAKLLSERFGKIMQDRQSLSINRTDTSLSKSRQLDFAIPASKISALSSGEFVGMVADNPNEKIKLKMFHAELMNNSNAINEEIKGFKKIPMVTELDTQQVTDNFYQIKHDILMLIDQEIYKINKRSEDYNDDE